MRPLMVFDDTGRLIYGQEVLAAIVLAKTPIDVVQIQGVRLPDET